MAKVRKFTWKHPRQRTKREAWGYVGIEAGKHRTKCADVECRGCQQVRVFKSEWTREDAETALSTFKLKLQPKTTTTCTMTLQQAIERYATAKARKKSIEHDVKYHLPMFVAAFGADLALSEITPPRIAAWRDAKLAAVNPRTNRPFAGATVNRPLAALRCLLRLAFEEWGVLPALPGKVRTADEPEGRLAWLEPDEEARLLDVCRRSKNPELHAIVLVALETGLRRGELLGLEWERVDLSRGIIRLEITKSGRRREVPMRQAVYEALAALPAREGRVFKTHSIRSAFEYAVKAAKIEKPGGFHFHDLRHHFASWFIMRGGTLPALQKLLGHADLKMTLRYAHLSPDHLRDEIAKTERPAQAAAKITDGITDRAFRPGVAFEVSRNSS